jgi:hypothetical protein
MTSSFRSAHVLLSVGPEIDYLFLLLGLDRPYPYVTSAVCQLLSDRYRSNEWTTNHRLYDIIRQHHTVTINLLSCSY